MKRLNYHHLLYFREIALENSVSKAAAKLRIGQPALSGQLKLLEDALGYKLFDRANRKLTLTEAGKFALQGANDIHKSGMALLDVMEKGSLSARTPLRIGVLNSVPKHLTLKLIRDARSFQECQLTILEGQGDELLRGLQLHSLDILILNYQAPISERGGIFSRLLTRSRIAVYGAPQFKHLRRQFPRSLGKQPFILPTYDSKLRHDVEHYFRMNDLEIEIFAETQDTSVQKLMGIQGYGLLPLPEFSTEELVREKKLIKLGVMAGVDEEFWLISAKRDIDNPLASRLIKDFKFSLLTKPSGKSQFI